MVRIVLVAALTLAWAARAHAYERARPMGLYPTGSGPALAMLDSRIEVTVRGPIVEAVVIQRFRNTSGHATEATYIFPLPADAAVSAMAMQIGTRTVHGAIEPRDAAQRRYEAAIAAGVAGALLEQERPDVFTQTVSAIPPGGIVAVTLRYDSVARYEAGTWQLAVPMVVAPRFVPGTASGRATTGSGRAPDTDRAPDASRVTPAGAPGAGGPTAIAIHFVDPPSELASPTHELGGTRRDAALLDPRSDHDAIVRWRAPAPAAGWVEREGDAGFAAVMVEAPLAPPSARAAPVRVTLAIDRAATTRGDGDLVEHPLVRALCGALGARDRVRAIGSDAVAWSAPGDALRALDRAWATPVPVFDLTRVLETAQPDGAPIVLVSDGLVADDPAAIAAARRLGVPVHVIGIGPAPARATLQQIAAASRGTVRYVVPGDDLGALVRAVLADLASPPAPLTVNWGTLGASDVEPAVLPRLGAGQAVLVLARIQRVQAANARTRGELFAFESLGPARPAAGALTSHGPLARRWARERLASLISARRDRASVTRHALAFGLVSPYTSLVAIGSDVVVAGGVKHSIAVPVSVPSGMQWQAVKQVLDGDVAVEPGVDPERGAPPDAEPRAGFDSDEGGAGQAEPDRGANPAADTSGRGPRAGAGASLPPPPPPAPATPKRPAPGTRPAPTAPAPAPAAEPVATESRAPARKEVSVAAPPTPASDVESELVLQSEALSISGRSGRALRLSAALGGGLAVDQRVRGLVSLTVRVEATGPLQLGGEAALWLVGGAHPEGRALVTVARGLARWLELGVAAGLHVGDGTGVAAALRLGVATPVRSLRGYARYDAAVLLTRPQLATESAITVGVELSY